MFETVTLETKELVDVDFQCFACALNTAGTCKIGPYGTFNCEPGICRATNFNQELERRGSLKILDLDKLEFFVTKFLSTTPRGREYI